MLQIVRAVLAGFLMMTAPVSAQSIIRDAEIEEALRNVAAPILRAAGLPASLRIMVVDDRSLNAFIVDSRTIFIHSGLIMRLDDPAELQAVIAHEAAHIANGHYTRRAANIGQANTVARLGLLLGLAAAVASDNPGAGLGLAVGTASSAQRVLFAHTRAEEASADAAGLRYMIAAGADPGAMLDVLDLFRGQEALSAARQDPYLRTHPLTRDRLRSIRALIAGAAAPEPDPTTLYWYQRMVAKLSAFQNAPGWTLRRVDRNDSSEIARLSRAIAYHRQADAARALAEVGALVRMRPNDPYYQELRGQILFESRNYGAATQAYSRAVALAPRNALILAGYGRALLAADTGAGNRQALEMLMRARTRDPFDPRMLRDLALAHARLGQTGLAATATAERYALIGRFEDAEDLAARALGLLPRGSPGWLRAQDVQDVAETALARQR